MNLIERCALGVAVAGLIAAGLPTAAWCEPEPTDARARIEARRKAAEARSTPEQRAKNRKAHEDWEKLTPEQQEAKRAESRAKMAEMKARRASAATPEQKAAAEKARKEWEAMTPEQREARRKASRPRPRR